MAFSDKGSHVVASRIVYCGIKVNISCRLTIDIGKAF